MRVLLFDLDDTLVPSSRAYDVGLRAIGIDPKDADFLKARADVKRTVPAGYPGSRSRRLYFKRYLENKHQYTPAKHLELVDSYERHVCSDIGKAWVKLNRAALFTKLRTLSDGIGIVSNETSTLQSMKLNAIDPEWRFFDFIVTSEDIGQEKPAPAIYARALELAGRAGAAVQPSDCIFIGDNFAFDIEAPLKLGMRAIQTVEFLTDTGTNGRTHAECLKMLDQLPVLL